MKIDLHGIGVRLGRRQMLRIRAGTGCAILVLEGSLLITQEQDIRDIELQAGTQFVIDRPGLTLIEAMAPAEIAIERIASTWLQRLVRYVFKLGGVASGRNPGVTLRSVRCECS